MPADDFLQGPRPHRVAKSARTLLTLAMLAARFGRTPVRRKLCPFGRFLKRQR